MTDTRLSAADAFALGLRDGRRLYWWHRKVLGYVEEAAEQGVHLTPEVLQSNVRWILGDGEGNSVQTPYLVEQLIRHGALVVAPDGFTYLPEPSA